MTELIDLVLHIDRALFDLAAQYGAWIYGILFLVVFAETGLVVTPFLPGDSLLFATGSIAAAGALDLRIAVPLLLAAAILGDAVNYTVGRRVGVRVVHLANTHPRWQRWINPGYIAQAHEFFERHGGKAVVIARFVPIVRTFIPFVAGAAYMSYPLFAFYNVTGAAAWVGLCAGAGYLFGNIPIVQENFSLVVLGIIAVSLLPIAVEFLRSRRPRAAGVTGRGDRSARASMEPGEDGGA